MTKAVLKNTFIISSLGHLLVFGLFNFSFDQSRFQHQEPPLVFWGQILPNAALNLKSIVLPVNRSIVGQRDFTVLPRNTTPDFCLSSDFSLKPQVQLSFSPEKVVYLPKENIAQIQLPKKDSPIKFHPLLPYQLQLYFKDRQAVHIELMFNIGASPDQKAILIKRKISSGNLEADLLSVRYINHYLFNQRSRFPLNTWQTVKIDLSTKND